MTAPTAPILLETADLLAVAKPPGVTVIPGRHEPAEACLRAALEATRGESLWVVHRLDRDTSGVVVFARTPDAHRTLSMAFERRRVDKRYLAFTGGGGLAAEGKITAPLRPGRRGGMRRALPGDVGARTAETAYVVVRRWTRAAEDDGATAATPATAALVEARPRTGRQHQIRVHLATAGAPILVRPALRRRRRARRRPGRAPRPPRPPPVDPDPGRRLAHDRGAAARRPRRPRALARPDLAPGRRLRGAATGAYCRPAGWPGGPSTGSRRRTGAAPPRPRTTGTWAPPAPSAG